MAKAGRTQIPRTFPYCLVALFAQTAQRDAHVLSESPAGRLGPILGLRERVSAPKRFVYILKSESDPDEYYVGVTADPDARLRTHNAGMSAHTAQCRPWRTLVCIEFDEEEPAVRRAVSQDRIWTGICEAPFSSNGPTDAATLKASELYTVPLDRPLPVRQPRHRFH